MAPERDLATVLDIVVAARRVLEFRGGLDFAAFTRDAKTQSAIIHQLLIIGEAAKRLSDGFRAASPRIPWDAIARMRDKMIHHYEGVDLREVWQAAEKDVPVLLATLEPLLPSEQSS